MEKKHTHPLMPILTINRTYDEIVVVRWCPTCGAVAIDVDVDGRTDPGRFMKMVFPANQFKGGNNG